VQAYRCLGCGLIGPYGRPCEDASRPSLRKSSGTPISVRPSASSYWLGYAEDEHPCTCQTVMCLVATKVGPNRNRPRGERGGFCPDGGEDGPVQRDSVLVDAVATWASAMPRR
jgi:hypothetical protein